MVWPAQLRVVAWKSADLIWLWYKREEKDADDAVESADNEVTKLKAKLSRKGKVPEEEAKKRLEEAEKKLEEAKKKQEDVKRKLEEATQDVAEVQEGASGRPVRSTTRTIGTSDRRLCHPLVSVNLFPQATYPANATVDEQIKHLFELDRIARCTAIVQWCHVSMTLKVNKDRDLSWVWDRGEDTREKVQRICNGRGDAWQPVLNELGEHPHESFLVSMYLEVMVFCLVVWRMFWYHVMTLCAFLRRTEARSWLARRTTGVTCSWDGDRLEVEFEARRG